MADEIRVWQVGQQDVLTELGRSKLNLEDRIEQWIARDVSVLDPGDLGLLVIGRQVRTDFGKEIDLLCIDSVGDLVIVELKREKTPREVTAQALDYTSWIQDLGIARLEEIATGYLNGRTLKDAFEEAFETEFPDVVNGDHSIRIVASTVDDSTERIIRYLSKRGIRINFVRFQMFKAHDATEFLVRTFTVPPEEAEQNALKSGTTKRPHSYKTLEDRAAETTNDAQRAFILESLKDPLQEKNRRGSSLRYRFAGRVRYSARGTKKHMHVGQWGRFQGDEQFWSSNLSSAHLGYRKAGAHLSFRLQSAADFEFFRRFLEGEANGLSWLDRPSDGLGDYGEDDEDEER